MEIMVGRFISTLFFYDKARFNVIFSWLLALTISFTLLGALKSAPKGLRGSSILSCYTLVLGLFAVYFLLPPVLLLWLREGDYVWAPAHGGYDGVILTELSVIMSIWIFIISYHAIRRSQSRQFTINKPVVPGRLADVLSWTFVIIGVILKLSVVFLSGGFQSTVTRLSRGIEDSLRLDALPAYITVIKNLSGVGDIAIVWLFLVALQNKRSVRLLSILLALVIALSFATTGKRLFLLAPIFMIILGVHYYRRPLTTSMAPFAILGVLIIGFVTLMYRIYAPASISDVSIDLHQVPWAEGSLFRFYFFSLEFSTFETLTVNLFDREKIVRLFGGSFEAFLVTNIEPISYLVPRVYWSGKPLIFYDLSHANRAFMLGGGMDEGGGIASTILGTSWTIAGPFGQLIAVVGLAAFSAVVDGAKAIRGIPSPKALIVYCFLIMLVFHLFRQGTLGWTLIIVVSQHIGIIIGFFAIIALLQKNPHAVYRPRNGTLPRRVREVNFHDN